MNEVHIYPVGILRDLRGLYAEARRIAGTPKHRLYREQRIKSFRYGVRRMVKSMPRRSYWNGYLAEPTTESIYWTRCGHGWTKRRAMASLVGHIGEVQRDGFLRYAPESAA